MIRKNRIPIGLILISITILLAYDFFPRLNELLVIPKPVIIGFLLLILFLGFYAIRLLKANTSKSNFVWQVIFMSYVFGLIIVFSLLGGVSQVGLSLSSPVLWIVLALSMFELFREYKKLKAAQLTS